MSRRKLAASLILWALMTAVLFSAIDERMVIRRYTVEADQVTAPVKLAVLTDFHGCDYGPDGAELSACVAEESPDAILLVGDMFSADGDPEEELRMFRILAEIAPTFYVTGNHEYWEYDAAALVERIKETGVTVLFESCEVLEVKGQRLNICGVTDPVAMYYVLAPDPMLQLAHTALAVEDPEAYTILLAHRPELIDDYAASGAFDLVLSGHAHGGQVRIPGLINGLFAPNQGWFPKYAGGRYDVEGMTMIVSRGLSTQDQKYIPRVFNRPELVVVEIR